MNQKGVCDIFECPKNKMGKCEIDGLEFGTIEKDGTGIVSLGPERCFHRKFKKSFGDKNP